MFTLTVFDFNASVDTGDVYIQDHAHVTKTGYRRPPGQLGLGRVAVLASRYPGGMSQ